MEQVPELRIYETLGISDLAAQGIRPGGLNLTSRALDLAGLPERSRIFDLGCGTGVTAELMGAKYKYHSVGVDCSDTLLRYGKSKRMVTQFVRGRADNLPFPNKSADGIIAECSLSVMGYSGSLLNELCRVLMFNGKLVVTDVYARNETSERSWEKIPMDCCLKGAISRERIFRKMKLSSFEIDVWEDHSDALKEFAVRIILSYGSMDKFWGQMSDGMLRASEIGGIISMVKPGYYLMVAHKSQFRFNDTYVGGGKHG